MALFNASSEGDSEAVLELLNKTAVDIDFRNGGEDEQTPLHAAAKNGHLQIVITLVESGAEIDAEDKFGQTPLYLASRAGHLDVVEYLIGQFADVNVWENYGRSPLWTASFSGHNDVVKLLLEYVNDHG